MFLIVPFELKFSRRNANSILKGRLSKRDTDWIFTTDETQIICHFKGVCLFKLDYYLDDLGMVITHAHLNRNPQVYKGTNTKQDLVDIHYTILKFLLKQSIHFHHFKQRSIPLNMETAKGYILSGKSEWVEDPDFVVTERHFRNQVVNFTLITDKKPDPNRFRFLWFDHLYPRGGTWKHTLSRMESCGWTPRDEIYAWEDT